MARRFVATIENAVIAVVVLLAGCTNSPATEPGVQRLAGVYSLQDWLYVVNGDTLPITDDSFVRIEFIDDEHVRGEGLVFLLIPHRTPSGDIVYDRRPILADPSVGQGFEPADLDGWYYIRRGAAGDTLRFRFAKDQGAGTWVESFDWILSDDWDAYRMEFESRGVQLRIVHRND